MPRDNKTTYLILGMLSHEPMTGYDIKKRMKTGISYFWNVGYGQIYPTIEQMRKNGLIALDRPGGRDRRGSKVYSITPAGRAALKKWLMRPIEGEPVRYEILLKIFFSSIIPPEKTIEHIKKFLAENEENAATMKAFEKNLSAHLEDNPDHRYFLYTVRFGAKVYGAYCEWARETIADLEKPGKSVGYFTERGGAS